MAIDHDSRSKELRLKNQRVKGSGGGGHETEEDDEAAAGAEAQEQEQDEVVPEYGGERCPPWLRPLLSARFYTHCEAHAYLRRGGARTMFCLHCAAGALCHLCLAHGHRGHCTIQIRRSSYSNVIRVSDIRGLLDIEGVQTYVINGARVVFLNERPQPSLSARTRWHPVGAKLCECCGRALLDNFRFCSLGCKFAASCSHDSNISSSPLRNAVTQIFPSPLPPPMPAKRRKGIPRRAPFGNLIVN